MLGKPTIRRYTYSTVYVDQYSGYTYLHLQYSDNKEQKLKVKDSF